MLNKQVFGFSAVLLGVAAGVVWALMKRG